jgi:phage shock protein A
MKNIFISVDEIMKAESLEELKKAISIEKSNAVESDLKLSKKIIDMQKQIDILNAKLEAVKDYIK